MEGVQLIVTLLGPSYRIPRWSPYLPGLWAGPIKDKVKLMSIVSIILHVFTITLGRVHCSSATKSEPSLLEGRARQVVVEM
jgi:hypothetical protein